MSEEYKSSITLLGPEGGKEIFFSAKKMETPRTIDGVAFDGTADIANYAVCTTAAATVKKVASVTGFALVGGAAVDILFQKGNDAANPTLNVNGTGAKPILLSGGAAAGRGCWEANTVVRFRYDGSAWRIVGSASGKPNVTDVDDGGVRYDMDMRIQDGHLVLNFTESE